MYWISKAFRRFMSVTYNVILGSINVVLLAVWAEKICQKVNKSPSIEGILCTTGFYKLLGLPQRIQI